MTTIITIENIIERQGNEKQISFLNVITFNKGV
jgi:uracil phosphoribosyltransferase